MIMMREICGIVGNLRSMSPSTGSGLASHIYLILVLAALAPMVQAQPSQEALLQSFQWRNVGPANMGGRVVDIEAVETDFARVYLASASGGVWKSQNAGTSSFGLAMCGLLKKGERPDGLSPNAYRVGSPEGVMHALRAALPSKEHWATLRAPAWASSACCLSRRHRRTG